MKSLAIKTLICTLALLGMTPFTAYASGLDSPVSYQQYAQWPTTVKVKYVSALRLAFYELETGSQHKMEFAGTRIQRFWLSFLPEAFAASEKLCMIGGIRRSMVPSGDRYLCPTGGRPCGSFGEAGFQCGVVYNDACISRQPLDSISRRCLEAAGNAPLSPQRYEQMRSAIQSVAADCRGGNIDDRFKSQCDRFLSRLNTSSSAPPEAADVAGVVEQPALTDVQAHEVASDIPVPTRRPNPPARTEERIERPEAADDCIPRNRGKLGVLACVACGMENNSPAEIRNHGGGVSKWVALVGVMAQTGYGPFNVNDEHSRKAYQQRVAEMISSYGYCTDREYQITPPNGTRDLIDGRAMGRSQQLQFAQSFGLMSTVKGFWSGEVENQRDPLKYANKIFTDNGRASTWNGGNIQNRQWRFRSMLKAHRNSYRSSTFTKCANAVENRLSTSKKFRMCPIREGKWPNGGLKIIHPKQITDTELANNQNFYDSIATSCGLPKQRRIVDRKCDTGCWNNRGVFRHAVSHMTYCESADPDQGGGGDNPGKGGEDSSGRSNDGKGGEDSSGRSDGGGNGGGGDGGSDSGGGKGGETGGSTR